jgi:hypothetical protein
MEATNRLRTLNSASVLQRCLESSLGEDQLTNTQHLQISANAMPWPAALVPLDARIHR